MSSSIFMHDVTTPEDKFLEIKSEQDKFLESLPLKIQKTISVWRAKDDKISFWNNLEAEEKDKLGKYMPLVLPLDQQAKILRLLNQTEKSSLIKSLPPKERKLLSDWSYKTKHEQVRFFSEPNSSREKVAIFKYLTLAEQVENFKYLKNSEGQLSFFRSFKDESIQLSSNRKPITAMFGVLRSLDLPAQEELYKSLNSKEKIAFFDKLDRGQKFALFMSIDLIESNLQKLKELIEKLTPEETKRLFLKLKSKKKQITLFLYLTTKKQALLLESLPPEIQTKLFQSLDPSTQTTFFSSLNPQIKRGLIAYLPGKEKDILTRWFITPWKERNSNFANLKIEEKLNLAQYLKVKEQEELVDSLELNQSEKDGWKSDLKKKEKLLEDEKLEDFSLAKRIGKSDSVFKSLELAEKIWAFKTLNPQEKEKVIPFLPVKDQEAVRNWFIKPWKTRNTYFTSLTSEEKVKLLTYLELEDQVIFLHSLEPEEQKELGYLVENETRAKELKSVSKVEDLLDGFKSSKIARISNSFFSKLESEDQIALFNSLKSEDQIQVFRLLEDPKEQSSFFQRMYWEEQKSLLESLTDWEEKTKLFETLNSEEKIWIFNNLKEQLTFFTHLSKEEKDILLDYLEKENEYLKQIQSHRKKWEAIKTSGAKIEENLDHFYSYQFHHPRFLQIIIVILGLMAMAVSLNFTFQFFNKKPVEPIYTKVEGIKRLGEMHLVKQQYESVIPITKQKENRRGEFKKERLQFLLIAPIEVTGYIDFGSLELQVLEDSVMEITLPEPQISKAYLDFARTEEFRTEGKFRVFGQYLERMNHKEAYYDIARGINNAKERVRKSAEMEHYIKEETQEKAYTFLRNFGSTLGYRVQFRVDTEEPPAATVASDSTSVEKEKEEGFSLLSRLSEFGNSVLNK